METSMKRHGKIDSNEDSTATRTSIRESSSRDYGRESTASASAEHNRGERGGLIEEWIRNARERREDRRQQRQERRNEGRRPRDNGGVTAKDEELTLKNEGGLKEFKLPSGFTRAKDVEASQLNYNEKRIVFECKGSTGTRVCYSKDEGWTASQHTQDALKKLLAKPAHKLTDAETDDIAEAIPKPPFGTRGPFTVAGLSTKEVNGTNVLVMEISNDNTDRRVYGIFFNPKYPQMDQDSKTAKAGTLESIWFEANGSEFNAKQKQVLDAIHTVKFA